MENRNRKAERIWQVYIILCSDNSLYTGITTDARRRLAQHAAGTGAKYFRGRLPVCFVYLEEHQNRSSASRREAEIKRLRPSGKRGLIAAAGCLEGLEPKATPN